MGVGRWELGDGSWGKRVLRIVNICFQFAVVAIRLVLALVSNCLLVVFANMFATICFVIICSCARCWFNFFLACFCYRLSLRPFLFPFDPVYAGVVSQHVCSGGVFVWRAGQPVFFSLLAPHARWNFFFTAMVLKFCE